MSKTFSEAIDRLAFAGWASIDGFLSPDEVKALLQRFQTLERDGNFQQAGIGKLQHHTVDRSVRGDYIYWLGSPADNVAEQELLERINTLLVLLNRTCFLGLRDMEVHMAHYPPGTFYRRHRDRFVQLPHRIISLVIYLNEGWAPSDGGELIIVDEAGAEHTVAPLAGRLVLFKSELEHEVCTTKVDRYSVTGWLLDQPVGLTFL